MENLDRTELCFPHLLNTSCRKPAHPEIGVMFYFLSFVSVLTTALNLLVIISISHFRQLRTTTNLLLLSLAVSDFLVGLVVIPGEIILKSTCWYLGDLVCVVYNLLTLTITCSIVICIMFISVDRYVAICYPLHYSTKVTLKRGKVCVCLCWNSSLFISILFLYDSLKQPGKYNYCYGECVIDIARDADLVVNFIIPITIIITLYFRVFIVAVSQARAMRSHTAPVRCQRSSIVTVKKSELKAARTLGITVAVFLMCYCPYYCVSLAYRKIPIRSLNYAFVGFMVYFSSCLNPIIYAFIYPWFRNTIRLIVTLQIAQPASSDAIIL